MISKQIAKKFIENGLSVIPVGDRKIPSISWTKYQSVLMQDWEMDSFEKPECKMIGIATGIVSGNLEIIDIDCKYDLTGTIYEEYVKEIPPELMEKLVIQNTPTNGYHIVYRCDKIEGNKKLAQRHTTEEEKAVNSKEKVKVLFETRGQGGYFVAAPSKGYSVIQGKFSNIPKLEPKERDFLIELAMSFNQYVTESYLPKEVSQAKAKYAISPFDDFDNKCDVVGLLEQHGWTMARQFGNKFYMKRQGTENRWSAEYDREKNWFTVFSTSTEFESLKAYKPYAVYSVLNGFNDFSQLREHLLQQGYGMVSPRSIKTSQLAKNNFEITPEEQDDDYTFLSSWREVRKKVEDFVEGRIPMGLKTGFWRFDEYFRFKRGNLVIVNGHDNAGKTSVILFLAMISAVKHGWKWCIFSTENSDLSIMQTLIQYYCGKRIHDTTNDERNEAQIFIEAHFANIIVDEALSYKDLKLRFVKLKRIFDFDAMLIDPYNSLDSSSAANSHSFDYSVINDVKIWGRNQDVSIYINTHAVTSALRKVDENGYVLAPNKGDAEGGTKFAAKADEWITIHRVANHQDERVRRITELHIRKVKEVYTGGKQTSIDKPFQLLWEEGGSVYYDAEDAMRTHPFLHDRNSIDFEEVINDVPF